MYAITLSSKYRMPIPKGIREKMGLQPGQRFSVIAKGSTIELVPIGDIVKSRGRLKGANGHDAGQSPRRMKAPTARCISAFRAKTKNLIVELHYFLMNGGQGKRIFQAGLVILETK